MEKSARVATQGWTGPAGGGGWLPYLLVTLLCATLVHQTLRLQVVAGRSMEPALSTGQLVLAIREPLATWLMGPVERFALITFRPPGHRGRFLLIKRVIGQPGDALLVKGQHVEVLGRPATASRSPVHLISSGASSGAPRKWTWRVCAADSTRERALRLALYRQGADEVRPLPGSAPRHRPVCNDGRLWRVRPLSAMQVHRLQTRGVLRGAFPLYAMQAPDTVAVPPGHVYVLGDNRPVSRDSRAFGAVPLDRIEGRVIAF